MAYSKAQRDATERYNTANYDKITVRLPAGRRDLLEDMATDNSMSVNKLVNIAIARTLGVSPDAWKDSGREYHSEGKQKALAAGYTEQVVFRAPPDAVPKLQHLADRQGCSVDDLINAAIIQYTGVSNEAWLNPLRRDGAEK